MKVIASNGRFRSRCVHSHSWCFPDDPTEATPYSRSVLRRMEEADVVVPEIWAFEIANGIFVAYSIRKRINEADIQEVCSASGIPAHPGRPSRMAWERRVGISGEET